MSGNHQKTQSFRRKTCRSRIFIRPKKEDLLHPIISLTIYYGEDNWDGPCSLQDMIIDMPEDIRSVFPDYPMNLLEVRDSEKYIFHNPDVQTVFEISREAMAGHFDKIQEKYRDVQISSELLTVIGTMISSRELQVMGENKEVDNVCTAIERLKRENLEKGIEEGKILLVKTLLLNGLSTEEVKKYAAVTDQEIQRAKELS